MASEKLDSLSKLRHSLAQGADSATDGGWLSAALIAVAVLIVLGTIASSLALPLVLLRLHQRLRKLEQRLDELTGGKA